MITIGLDIGSVATKGVLITGSKQHRIILPTGWSPREAGYQTIDTLLSQEGIERKMVHGIVVTGYGRVALEEADKTITEISCHARGISATCPEVKTIIDIGGQDSKIIRINGAGKVLDFAMNDKCAAGTGRFLQVMAVVMGLDIGEMGARENPETMIGINSMCTVFAESEIIGLLARGMDKGGIIAGLHQSVGKRVTAMARRLGLESQIAFTGGVAKNSGVIRALTEELGREVLVPANCQFTGALGAALLAREL